jgi:hypothetical protein
MATGTTNFNNELVKCIEELRDKREELNKTIIKVNRDIFVSFDAYFRKKKIRRKSSEKSRF